MCIRVEQGWGISTDFFFFYFSSVKNWLILDIELSVTSDLI